MNRLRLAVRTAAHLKPIQVLDRLLRPVRRRLPTPRPPRVIELAESRPPLAAWLAAPPGDLDEILAGRITLLGQSETLDRSVWTRRPNSLLWSYELQYFAFAIDLAAEYSRTGRPECLVTLRRTVTDWIETTAGRSGDGWDAYPTAARITNWLRVLSILARNDEARPLREIMLPSLWQQAAHLRNNLEYHLLGNHLLKDLTALGAAALSLEWSGAAGWRRFVFPRLWREIDEQFLPDGMHFERSPMYHDLALADCLEVVALCDHGGEQVPNAVRERLRLSIAAAHGMKRNDGSFHAFNDSARRGPVALATLRSLAEVAGRQETQVSRDGALVLQHAGYFGYSQDGDRLVVDAGPLGPDYQPGHGHCDLLSFEFDIDGMPVIVDSGTSGYAEEALRAHQRSTAAHNTLEFNGKDQAELWSVFRVARRPVLHEARQMEDAFRFIGSYSPYHDRRIVHRRSIERLGRGSVRVLDSVAGAWRTSRGFLHFHPDLTARIDGTRVVLESPTGVTILIESEEWSALQLTRGAMDPPQGWYAKEFGCRVPSFALEYEPFASGRDRCTVTIRRV